VIGAVVAVLGLALRYKIGESPLFLKVRERKELAKAPAVEVLKHQWFPIMLMAVITSQSLAQGSIAQKPFSVNYLQALGVSSSFASYSVAISAGVGIFICILGGYLGDVIGRKWTIRIGIGIPMFMVVPSFIIMQTKNPALIILAQIMFFSFTYVSFGNFASSFTEQFETKYRNSGAGLGYQFGAFINGIVTVAVVAPILSFFKGPLDSWPYVLAVVEVMAVCGFICTFFMKETKGVELR
jgi:MFS family permease